MTLINTGKKKGTGGISTGRNVPFLAGYPNYEWFPEIVLGVTKSVEVLASMIYNNGMNSTEVLLNYTGILPTPLEQARLDSFTRTSYSYNKTSAIADIISSRSSIGWTTWGHVISFVLFSTLSPFISLLLERLGLMSTCTLLGQDVKNSAE